MLHILRYTEELEKVGFTMEQAKASVQMVMNLMDQNFATKGDFKEHYYMTKADLVNVQSEMKDLRSELQNEMKDLRSELQNEMKVLRSELQNEMKDLRSELNSFTLNTDFKLKKLENSLTLRMGGMCLATITILSLVITFKH